MLEDLTGKRTYIGTDSFFVAAVERIGHYHQLCMGCGDCMLNDTGGICPVTRCPKGLRNGPCEGHDEGHCEVNRELSCVWMDIPERLRALGEEQGRPRIYAAPRWSQNAAPRSIVGFEPAAAHPGPARAANDSERASK